MKRIWVVASGPAAERWTRALGASSGVAVVPLPWSEILPVADPSETREALGRIGPDLVLLTSPNVAQVLPEGVGAGFEAACVGNLTASVASSLGFTVRHVGRGTGADLARELIRDGEPGLVLFLRGDVVRREGLELLEAAGWCVEERVVYEARPRPMFPEDVAEAPAADVLLVGSPQAAEALAQALDVAERSTVRSRPAICLGTATARSLGALGFVDVRVTEEAGLRGIQQALRRVVGGDASP